MQNWQDVIGKEKQSEYFVNVMDFVKSERQHGKVIFPAHQDIFNAMKLTDFAQVKVVILGQDPYHGPNQAHGLCFSVQPGIVPPPSLKNIYKELHSDVGCNIPSHGYLEHWAKQGVLLLNTVLTVEANQAHSHRNMGWEQFTDQVIRAVSQYRDHVVFLLWGSPAQRKAQLIDANKHTILTAPHPSPLSAHRGFLGCKHFSKTNTALQAHQQTPIDWQLPMDLNQ